MTYIPVLIALLLLFGYGAYIRMRPVSKSVSQTAQTPVSTMVPIATPSASIIPPSPSAQVIGTTPLPTTVATPNADQLLYPGVQKSADNTYTTATKGKEVFDWYKNQLTAAGFHIGVSVSSSANEVYKGVLQATKEGVSMNIAIEQPGANQETKITITDK